MPTIREDITQISPYRPGRPVEEVARELGFDPAGIVKLASNESPLPPVTTALAAMTDAVAGVNRYPDNDCHDLRHRLAAHLDVGVSNLWVGAGSSELLRVVATAVGGAGTNAVYAWPSFVVYRLASIVAGSSYTEVPLDGSHRHDLSSMTDAIDDTTTVVYVCNPNNPTGSHLSAAEITEFIEQVPERVLVVIDEAYHEYVTAEDYDTAINHAIERTNVVVTRTFSKVYGLAALRVGYGIGHPETIGELRKAQAPFTVTSLGQIGAVASLEEPHEIRRRVEENAIERSRLEQAFATREIEFVRSQANFVYLRLGASTATTTAAFLEHGVILRPFSSGWIRVSVGTRDENDRFLTALDAEADNLGAT